MLESVVVQEIEAPGFAYELGRWHQQVDVCTMMLLCDCESWHEPVSDDRRHL
jgi:hypothetical protein